jgi:Flp pilus assembly protein CpaB
MIAMGSGGRRRTGLILIVLILVVVLIGVGGLYVLQRVLPQNQQAGDGGDIEGEETTTPEPTTVNVIVANRSIPRGARLSAQDVRTVDWPDTVDRPLGALEVGLGEDDPSLERVEGSIARVDILGGQPILDFMLSDPEQPELVDTGSDIALEIPSGTVMVAMPITRLSAVGYALRPGDHVDVLMSFTFVDIDEEFQTLGPNQGIVLTDDEDLASLIGGTEIPVGREEQGPFGSTLLIVPNTEPTGGAIPRQTTQLVIDNAIVTRLGTWPLSDIDQPIVVTPAPPSSQETEETQTEGGAPAPAEQVTPTPLPSIPVPDIITLAMSRQDALVLKYALENEASVDLALRSALDDDITDIQTDAVTLEYITSFYGVDVPPALPYAIDPRVNLLDILGGTGAETGGGGANEATES